MQSDVAIIGGGLAGLSCGIRLAEQGKKCTIISAGQSALHFSSGSLDFLNYLPDGQTVQHPLNSLSDLAKQAPNHPYSLLGENSVALLAQQAQLLLSRSGLTLHGDIGENHQRMTPMGGLQPSWLSHEDVPVTQYCHELPWQCLAIIGIDGFLDFHPQLTASALAKQNKTIITDYLYLPVLDNLRSNPSEFRSVNISRVLDRADNLTQLAHELIRMTADYNVDAIILPACLGLDNPQALKTVQQIVNKPIMLLPTLPPSILGRHIHQKLEKYFRQLGGQIMVGDAILQAEIKHNQVIALHSRNHTDIPISAKQFVLASGSFFSNGLVADFDRIYEPIFALDVKSKENSADWSNTNFFQQQAYFEFGVKTTPHLQGLINGETINNLYVVGAVLGGFNPLKQGCGAGVAMITAQYVAEQILTIPEVLA